MRRLILLRHAKSDWSEPGKADLGRPLNPRGREAAVLIGEYMMKHHLVPDRAVVSTAERTRETFSLVAGTFKQPPKGSFDARLYEAPPEILLDVIKETKPVIHTLLVIGHNPGLHELATLLIGTGDVDMRQRVREKLPTGALVAIDFVTDDWGEIRPGSGRLDRFVTPRSLVDAADTA